MATSMAAPMLAMPGADVPPPFSMVVAGAAIIGIALALMEDDIASSAVSHVDDCADSAYALLADSILALDGGGLGRLDPLRELFATRPNGLLGINGLVDCLWGLCATAVGLVRAAVCTCGRRKKKESTVHDKIKMSFSTELSAYWGYLTLFALGVFREYTCRLLAVVWGTPPFRRFATREKWETGWVDFFKTHMYKGIVDCFNRPICSSPDAVCNVVVRKRAGGTLFGPLFPMECTEDSRPCVNLSSYNYLGFGGIDDFCTPDARAAALSEGFSPGGTRSEGGTLQVHRDLEAEVAKYLQKEDALVLGMGFASNSTVLPALFEAQAGGSGFLVLSDELNHRSIVEGIRLSGATVRAFAHNDMAALEERLKKAIQEGQPKSGAPWRKIFIVVEGIYSMEGDFCKLRDIVTLKNRYKAYLYLDEAHSIGAVGASGRGVTELFGVPTSEVEVMMGTFTKSFGSAGGYVAASREVINALRVNAPGSVFAFAMSAPFAAQALAAFRSITGEKGGDTGAKKLAAIKENSNFFRKRLVQEGFKVLGDMDSPILPVMLHHPKKMASFSRECLQKGIAVVIVGYPAVPVLYERVRFCISAAHDVEQLERVIVDITEIGRRLGVLFEKGKPPQKLGDVSEFCLSRLECRDEASIAPAAVDWSPEPLVPSGRASPFDLASLSAVTTVQPRKDCEFRLFDALGYAKRPPPPALEAIKATMDIYGFGACGPRGFYGTTMPHLQLEASIAKFLGTDAAINYSSGAVTASSVIPALVQPYDRIIIDSEVHLGIRAGLRLCKAEFVWVPHNDMGAIEAALSRKPAKAGDKAEQRRTFIVAEGIYQRTGAVTPLKELVALKEKYGAMLVLDESLSIGTLGAHGRGLCEHFGIDVRRVDAIIGSIEHAITSVGGFCAGRMSLIDHQRLGGAGYVFSAACPPAACSVVTAMLEDLSGGEATARLDALSCNTKVLHETLRDLLEQAPSGKLVLISSPTSFVQHMRWIGESGKGAEQLVSMASVCAQQGGVNLQVCSSDACTANGAFGERVGAPPAAPPTIRVCASADHEVTSFAKLSAALKFALNAVK